MPDLGFSLAKFSLGSFSLLSITMVAPKTEEEKALPTLPIPFRKAQSKPRIFDLLDWRIAIAKMVGRDEEMEALRAWADHDNPISVKIISGPGGAGKSRLAGQFALSLQDEDWSAGFVKLDGRDQVYRQGENGSLLIIDYPEERQKRMDTLFEDLAALDGSHKLRILFLTRTSFREWQSRMVDHGISSLIDHEPIRLSPLEAEDAQQIMNAAQEFTAEIEDTLPEPFSEEMAQAWIDKAESNRLPLYLVAIGIFSSMWPDKKVLSFTAPEIISGLVERELRRVRKLSKKLEGEEDTLPRLLAMATIAGSLSWQNVQAFEEPIKASFGIPLKWPVAKPLVEAGWLEGESFPAIQPDIVGAGFVSHVLSKDQSLAPELVRQAILNVPGDQWMENLCRIGMDMKFALRTGPSPADRLAQHLSALDRYDPALLFLTEIDPPYGMAGLCAAACENALSYADIDSAEQGGLLNNASNRYSEIGDTKEAVETIERAVTIYEKLAEDAPARFLPDLATILSNASSCYSEIGDTKKAVETIEGAVAIFEKLAEDAPARFLPDLAMSLNNASNSYSKIGDTKKAVETIEGAVAIFEKLAEDAPARFLPNLAASLNNASNRYSEIGDTKKAVETIERAVVIRKKLAEDAPARFLPDLAMSLNNASSYYSQTGDTKKAVETIERAVVIREKLAEDTPARFLPDLAMSLNNASNRYSEIGDTKEAVETIERAVTIYEKLAEDAPARFLPDLAKSLGARGSILKQTGELEQARASFQRGLDIIRPFAEAYPGSPMERTFTMLSKCLAMLESRS